MVFGPTWNEAPTGAHGPPAAELLLPSVRATATELLDALSEARRLSEEWTDEPLADALVDRALSIALASLARTGCWGKANQVPSGELWKIAGAWLEVGSLQQRARFKPLGYAGDYQLLAWICRGTCCEHPWGRFFDRFFQRQAAPEAVRGRTQQAAAALAAHGLRGRSGPYHVVSVGVGPGLDVAAGLVLMGESRRRDVRLTLMDLDDAGLAFAAEQSRPLLPDERIAVVRENLFRLAQKPQAAERLARADFILCTGLFDYLDDAAAVELLRLFWNRLAPAGEMLLGNFAPHCPTRAYMEWIGNWYLNYRTPRQLADLAAAAGLPAGRWSVGSERLGVDLFLAARKG